MFNANVRKRDLLLYIGEFRAFYFVRSDGEHKLNLFWLNNLIDFGYLLILPVKCIEDYVDIVLKLIKRCLKQYLG